MRKNKIIVLNLIKKHRFGTIIIYLPHYNISLAIQAQASASAKKARGGGFISDIINNHLLTDYSENYLIFILIYICVRIANIIASPTNAILANR